MASRPKNIILLVSDSLRYDTVYRDGEAGVKYMQENGIQFSNARSAACWTLPATSSLFSGLMPHEHGTNTHSRKFRNEIPSLAGRLKGQGYKPIMVTANSVTTEVFNLSKDFDELYKIWNYVDSRHPMLLRLVLMLNRPRIRRMVMKPNDEIFSELSEDLSQGLVWAQKTCTDLFAKTKELMKANNEKGQSNFFFLNMMETHYPYHVNDTFELLSKSIYGKGREWYTFYHLLSQTFMKTGKQTIADDMLELFKERQRRAWLMVRSHVDEFIEELHRDQDNLIVFCSDHGENFGDQGWQYHFNNVTDAGNRVPLFWMGHDHPQAQIMRHNVSSRFIYQSILEAAGCEKQAGTLFEETPVTMPMLQSYWYNNDGRTMDQYKYNQFCFIEGNDRYVLRGNEWMYAPVATDGMEPTFNFMGAGIDPVQELGLGGEKKLHLEKTIHDFRSFSDVVMQKSLHKYKK
ncbi:MAG: sulfatase-like hydrolase/transferase [Bacteroidetes bacterium]|nr:sulfatase-like hydrolase/transferase [Bacteroidota bacterium]